MLATNTGARSHGYEASAEPHRTRNESTAAVQSSPEGNRTGNASTAAEWSSPEGNSNVMLPLLNDNNNNNIYIYIYMMGVSIHWTHTNCFKILANVGSLARSRCLS